jgi:hypothetical protein
MARRQASRPWTDPKSPQYPAFYHADLALNREKSVFFAPELRERNKGAERTCQPCLAGPECPAAGTEAGIIPAASPHRPCADAADPGR